MTAYTTSPSLIPEPGPEIVARLERLPLTSWQVKTRVIVGAATFFDAFDALAIAYALPVLAPLWHLGPQQIGLLISSGFVGQLIGALAGGWLAERFGRRPIIVASTAWFGIFSLACAFAPSYEALLVLRVVQGLGLGAEVPVAATFISEIARSHGRGRFVLLFELIFPVGLVASGFIGSWIVPAFGWPWLFAAGSLPILLSVFMARAMPESPRWMVSRGLYNRAEQTTRSIEELVEQALGRPLPPPGAPSGSLKFQRSGWSDLFGPLYRRRTLVVWVCWFATYFVNFGLVTWLPSVYQNVFKMPLGLSLRYALLTSALGFFGSLACALLIDRVGRRIWFCGSFVLAFVGLCALALIGPTTPERVLVLATTAYLGIGSLSLGLYLYTAELYPTRARAIAVGAGTAWLRIASIIAPFAVGSLIAAGGLDRVFLMFAAVSAVAAVVVGAFAVETKERVLEEISP